jgi:hypothetical protein
MRAIGVVALACLALSGCQPKKPESLRIDPSLEAMIPAGTVFIAGADIDAIRDTPVYQKLLGRMPLPQLDEFTQQTGLDPRKDLSRIISCTNGKTGLLMARGKFNVKDLEARLETRGAKRSAYKNRSLFGDERMSIVFMNSTTAIAGSASELRSLVDQGSGGGRGLPPALRDLIRTIPANDQIWAALTGGLQGLNIGIPPNSNLENIMNALQSIDTATVGMDLSKGFGLTAAVTCRTERDAKFVHDMVRGVVGLGRLNTPDNHPEFLKLYDAIKVTQQQTHAQVTAEIPADLADRFMDLWLKR